MKEKLPEYSATLSRVFLVQCRFECSYEEWIREGRKQNVRGRGRGLGGGRWRGMCVEIDSTQVLMRKFMHERDEVLVNELFAGKKVRGKDVRDSIINSVLNKDVSSKKAIENLVDWNETPVETYTMQFACVGVNIEEQYCVRLRVGDDQFSLRCRTERMFYVMYHALVCAAGISLPLEFRELLVGLGMNEQGYSVKTLDYYEPWTCEQRWVFMCWDWQKRERENRN